MSDLIADRGYTSLDPDSFARPSTPPTASTSSKWAIDTLDAIAGILPTRAMRLVREWGQLHQGELAAMWDRGGAPALG